MAATKSRTASTSYDCRQRASTETAGAHALLQCTALITRDARFFRDYFKGLKLIVPRLS